MFVPPLQSLDDVVQPHYIGEPDNRHDQPGFLDRAFNGLPVWTRMLQIPRSPSELSRSPMQHQRQPTQQHPIQLQLQALLLRQFNNRLCNIFTVDHSSEDPGHLAINNPEPIIILGLYVLPALGERYDGTGPQFRLSFKCVLWRFHLTLRYRSKMVSGPGPLRKFFLGSGDLAAKTPCQSLQIFVRILAGKTVT